MVLSVTPLPHLPLTCPKPSLHMSHTFPPSIPHPALTYQYLSLCASSVFHLSNNRPNLLHAFKKKKKYFPHLSPLAYHSWTFPSFVSDFSQTCPSPFSNISLIFPALVPHMLLTYPCHIPHLSHIFPTPVPNLPLLSVPHSSGFTPVPHTSISCPSCIPHLTHTFPSSIPHVPHTFHTSFTCSSPVFDSVLQSSDLQLFLKMFLLFTLMKLAKSLKEICL